MNDELVTQDNKESSTAPWLAIGVGLVLVVQLIVLAMLVSTNTDVGALRDDVDELARAAATPLASGDVPDLASAAPTDAATSEPTGGDLPRFLGGGADAALGRTLGELAAQEYYSGEELVIDPGDGVARAYMVWAHWCPYCQEELPMMAEWHAANAAAMSDFELVSITTSIDETAGNPLEPYLESNQFPFPVLVDGDGSLSQQLGVNAFPFWVFTAPDGTVVGRAAGLIGQDDLAAVLEQLDGLEATAMSSGS